MRVYLVRHGQTAWNLEQRAQGHTDTELDEMGQRQAQQVAAAFRGVPVERVVSSDLVRSAVTAQWIAEALGLDLELTDRLRERCFGEMEGKPYDEVRVSITRKAAQSGLDPFEARPDGGESYRDVWERIGPLVASLDGRKTVVVSHGGTIGLLIARMIAAGPDAARAFRITNASITELYRRGDGGWAIERLNDRAHLEATLEGFGTGA